MRDLAARCLLPSFPGYEPPAWVLRRLEGGVGGICLFAYNVRDREQLAALTAALREVRPGILIGIDEEGGEVTRLEADRGSSSPGNGALGVVDDVALTEAVAAAIGAELREVGVNLDFAPVADVLVNPMNSVIGIRSFGGDVDLVARHTAAFVRGLQGAGVAACAKHFPGHGATAGDSHLELPVVEGDVQAGLAPFAAAIEAGVATIMTAHVRVPALGELPATVNPAVVDGLLRRELGFDGLVIADALEMKGLSDAVGIERGAVLALRAGVDALLIGHDLGEDAVEAVQSALVEAVAAGELPEERLREAAARVERAAGRGSPRHEGGQSPVTPARAVARSAIAFDGAVALPPEPLVLELRPAANIAAGEAGHSFGGVLAERLPGARSVVLGEGSAFPAERPAVVVVRDAHRHAWMRELVGRLAPQLVVEIGVPVWRPESGGYAATYGGSRVSFEALADLVLAAVPA